MVKFLINNRSVTQNVSLSRFASEPEVSFEWEMESGKFYTLLLEDTTSRKLLMLDVNVTATSGRQVVKPQLPTEAHSFSAHVYEQSGRIQVKSARRANFSLAQFSRQHRLKSQGRVNFKVTSRASPSRTSRSPTRRNSPSPSRASRSRTSRSPTKRNSPSPSRASRSQSPRGRSPTRRNSASPSRASRSRSPGHKGYFKRGSSLTKKEESYCACVLHVAAKQPEWCLRDRAWRQKRGGATCYNPYAICAKSTRTSVGRSNKCSLSYDWEKLPVNELRAYAVLHNISIPRSSSRQTLVDEIYKWKSGER